MEAVIQALSDCERIRPGVLGQPANAASAVAFVATGLWFASKASDDGVSLRLRRYGAALVILGMGSIAYHGPGGGAAKWLHDVGLTLPPLVLATLALAGRLGLRLGNSRRLIAGSLTLVGLLLAARPAWTVAVTGMIVAVAAAAEMDAWLHRRRRRPRRMAAAGAGIAVLCAGAVVAALSRTGAPWCRPDSLLQGHAAWHVLAAAGLALYGWAALGAWTEDDREDIRRWQPRNRRHLGR